MPAKKIPDATWTDVKTNKLRPHDDILKDLEEVLGTLPKEADDKTLGFFTQLTALASRLRIILSTDIIGYKSIEERKIANKEINEVILPSLMRSIDHLIVTGKNVTFIISAMIYALAFDQKFLDIKNSLDNSDSWIDTKIKELIAENFPRGFGIVHDTIMPIINKLTTSMAAYNTVQSAAQNPQSTFGDLATTPQQAAVAPDEDQDFVLC